jgi:hypothetical protein
VWPFAIKRFDAHVLGSTVVLNRGKRFDAHVLGSTIVLNRGLFYSTVHSDSQAAALNGMMNDELKIIWKWPCPS